jgi:hypothetical protein
MKKFIEIGGTEMDDAIYNYSRNEQIKFGGCF